MAVSARRLSRIWAGMFSALARAGIRHSAPTMFTINMKVKSNPISAWNLMGEKIQVPTPMDKVVPVKRTARPVVFRLLK